MKEYIDKGWFISEPLEDDDRYYCEHVAGKGSMSNCRLRDEPDKDGIYTYFLEFQGDIPERIENKFRKFLKDKNICVINVT